VGPGFYDLKKVIFAASPTIITAIVFWPGLFLFFHSFLFNEMKINEAVSKDNFGVSAGKAIRR